jgi:small subunit ribosomal protein S17
MPRKKKDETVVEENAQAAAEVTETAEEVVAQAAETTEEAPKKAKAAPKKEAAPKAEKAAKAAGEAGTAEDRGSRAQRVGVVTSDKMTKTVVVRVDRLIKHPIYRRYVRRKKQFMAHDEMGAAIGDKVRIVETRPLSARKRWRVVEIIQKAAK